MGNAASSEAQARSALSASQTTVETALRKATDAIDNIRPASEAEGTRWGPAHAVRTRTAITKLQALLEKLRDMAGVVNSYRNEQAVATEFRQTWKLLNVAAMEVMERAITIHNEGDVIDEGWGQREGQLREMLRKARINMQKVEELEQAVPAAAPAAAAAAAAEFVPAPLAPAAERPNGFDGFEEDWTGSEEGSIGSHGFEEGFEEKSDDHPAVINLLGESDDDNENAAWQPPNVVRAVHIDVLGMEGGPGENVNRYDENDDDILLIQHIDPNRRRQRRRLRGGRNFI